VPGIFATILSSVVAHCELQAVGRHGPDVEPGQRTFLTLR
jgi:hypothetical protein